MEKEEKVDLTDLPQPQTNLTATQQGEEYIDKSNKSKDEDDRPGKQPADSKDDNAVPQQGNRDRKD